MKTKPKQSWAALLQQELSTQSSFSPEHKSFEDIVAELKAAKLPHGRSYVQRWLTVGVASGKIQRIEGSVASASGRRVRATRYLIK